MPDCESCKLLREVIEAKDALIKALSDKPAPVQLPTPVPSPGLGQTFPVPVPYRVGDPPYTYPGTLTSPPSPFTITNQPYNVCSVGSPS